MSEESQSQDGKKSPSLVAASDAGEAECGAQVDAATHTSQTNIAQVNWFTYAYFFEQGYYYNLGTQ